MPFLRDIYDDVKMRGGKSAKGISFLMWLDYSRLPEVIAQRLFDIFDTDQKKYLTQEEFVENMVNIYISPIA